MSHYRPTILKTVPHAWSINFDGSPSHDRIYSVVGWADTPAWRALVKLPMDWDISPDWRPSGNARLDRYPAAMRDCPKYGDQVNWVMRSTA